MHVQHDVLRSDAIEFRGYQANLARIAGKDDSLVVLPTGLGKTVVAALVLADAIKQGARRMLILAPTKPLVEQHERFIAETFTDAAPQAHVLTGNVPPKQRAERYKEEAIFCATPQVIENDVIQGRLDIASLDWIVFDEAHRAVGDYAYTFLGRKAQEAGVRRLGLTASPGHEVDKIQEVMANIGLPRAEVRTPDDPDVRPYVKETVVQWETLPLPETMGRVSARLRTALKARVRFLRDGGWIKGGGDRPTRRALLDCAHRLQAIARNRADVPSEVYAALSVQAQAMKLVHAIELAETQGSQPLLDFMAKMREEAAGPKPSKATLSILQDDDVNEACLIAKHDTQENPKLGRTEVLVRELIEADKDSRAIVFANYRDTCKAIAEHLGTIDGLRPVVFVGQGRRKGREGLTQKQQQELLDAFRAGTYNVLVATSVAEEGLDIPSTDLVVFYEPIASEIRSIQRRGRTGRHGVGRVVVLMTKGTQDEAAHWSARRKEQQMVGELMELRRRLAGGAAPTRPGRSDGPDPAPKPGGQQTQLAPPEQSGLRVLCDHREQASGVVRHLHDAGIEVDVRTLDVGDFVVSDRIVIERKTAADFVDSLLDQRIFEQVRDLQVYPKPLLVIEGGSIHGHRNVSPEALQGALVSIAVDQGVAVLQTRDAVETARLISTVAKREQRREKRRLAIRPGKKALSDDQRLRFILAGFPHVDEARADALLEHFGALEAVFHADVDELAAVEGIGPATARSIQALLARQYDATETVSRRT